MGAGPSAGDDVEVGVGSGDQALFPYTALAFWCGIACILIERRILQRGGGRQPCVQCRFAPRSSDYLVERAEGRLAFPSSM